MVYKVWYLANLRTAANFAAHLNRAALANLRVTCLYNRADFYDDVAAKCYTAELRRL